MHILLVFFLACGAVYLWAVGFWWVALTLTLASCPVGLLVALHAIDKPQDAAAFAGAALYLVLLLLIWTPHLIQRRHQNRDRAQHAPNHAR